jgi:hypothetical protein
MKYIFLCLFAFIDGSTTDVKQVDIIQTPRTQRYETNDQKLARVLRNIMALEKSMTEMTVDNVIEYRHTLDCIYSECRSLFSLTPGMQERLVALELEICFLEEKIKSASQKCCDSSRCVIL